MEIYFLTGLSFTGLWLWIVDKNNRIFCAYTDSHVAVLDLAQEKGFGITEPEVIGGGCFYLSPPHKSVSELRQGSGDFGKAPDEEREVLVDYFLAEGWSL